MKAHFDENFHSTMLNRFPKLYSCYSFTYRAWCTQNDLHILLQEFEASSRMLLWRLKMKAYFENESVIWKWKYILNLNFYSTMLNRFLKLYSCYSFVGLLQSTVYSKWFILLQFQNSHLFSKCAFIFRMCFHFQNVLSFSKSAFIFKICFHFQNVLPCSKCAFISKMCFHFQIVY